jgi:glycosyltransferase involved in cell wall biosynthesis
MSKDSSASDSPLLWVAPRWPFPADDGAKIAQERLMRPLSKQGFALHMLSIVNPAEKPKSDALPFDIASAQIDVRGSRSRLVTRLKGALGSLIKGDLPYSVRAFSSSSLRERSAEWIARFPDDAPIIVDGLHVAASLPWKTSSRWIYRAHNVEWRILQDAVQISSGPKRTFLRQQAALLKRFEKELIESARLTCAVSDADAVELRKLGPKAAIETLAIGANFSQAPNFTRPQNKSLKLLFVGRLDWAPNKDGLVWFLKEIWPRLDKGRFQLHVVGSGDGSYLQEWVGAPSVHIHGQVPELAPYYAQADVCLVPLRWASGTRVKIIEAVQFGRAVLSTSAGALGIELGEGTLAIRETPDEWVEILSKRSVAEWENQAERAWKPAADIYGETQIAEKLAGWLR